MTHQIDHLIKILVSLGSGATWWPDYMPKEGKNHKESEGKYEKLIYSTIRKKGVPNLGYVVPWVLLVHPNQKFGS